jgi:carbonic anhydrase
MSPVELGGEPLVYQNFELSFHYNSTYVKPYTLINYDKNAKSGINKPFLSFDLETKNGAGHLNVNLEGADPIKFRPTRLEFYSPALHTMSGVNAQFPLELQIVHEFSSHGTLLILSTMFEHSNTESFPLFKSMQLESMQKDSDDGFTLEDFKLDL